MAKDIRLQYVSDEGLMKLKNEFDSNLEKYRFNDQKYFLDMLNQSGDLLESAYVIKDFKNKLIYGPDNDVNDLHNVQVVYDGLKHIPRYIFMDDRFWAGLNHTIMWDYIRKRRDGEVFGEGIADEREKIFNSFFTHTKHGKKRGTYVNCVSRLWWAGYLTYDETNRDDFYALTKEVCATGFASTILLLSSYNILSRKEAMRALLYSVKEKRESGYKILRDDLVAGAWYLNLVAGISMIDIMSYGELKELLDRFYADHLKYRI